MPKNDLPDQSLTTGVPRVHTICGKIVNPDDPEEPRWFCIECQDVVYTRDTIPLPSQLG